MAVSALIFTSRLKLRLAQGFLAAVYAPGRMEHAAHVAGLVPEGMLPLTCGLWLEGRSVAARMHRLHSEPHGRPWPSFRGPQVRGVKGP